MPDRLSLRLLACAASVTALVAPACASTLTLAEALDRAARGHPALRALPFDERGAAARITQAGLPPNPELVVSLENFAGTGAARGARGLEATVEAHQPVERGGKRMRRIRLAEQEQLTLIHTSAARRNEVLARTAEAYLAALAADRRASLAETPVRLARETLALVESRLRAGAASPVDASRARAAVSLAEGDLARWRSARTTARIALASHWGGDIRDEETLAGEPLVPSTLDGPESFLAAVASHPALAYQRALIEARRAAWELERAQAVPDFSVGGGLRFLREGSDAALVASVSIPLPARHRNQGGILAAREALLGAEDALIAREQELRAAVTVAWHEVAARHAEARRQREETLPAVEESHALLRQAYESGRVTLLDVLDGQRELAAAQERLAEAEAAFVTALAQLEGRLAQPFPRTSALLSSP
jgi:cobalt-zinc-cadmium efflux system outer membrane protein